VYHADWGSDPRKRWCATAKLDTDGHYTASGPQPVGDLNSILKNLRAEAGDAETVFAGFDFPIGIPVHYAKQAGVLRFRDLLPMLGTGIWKDFYSVCDSPEKISAHRPFYPNRSKKGCRPTHLLEAHGAETMKTLLRQCERGGNGQRQACSLFWTLGGNQVGKAALIGWRDVLIPALRDDGFVQLWPFDGLLETLLQPGNTIIAETYPAECYGWFLGEPLRSKMNMECRKVFGIRLLLWAFANGVSIEPSLETAIKTGFPEGQDDAFDAVVRLFGMLQVCIGQRTVGEPNERPIRDVEGWILGRRGE
jgi:hypothetical protein